MSYSTADLIVHEIEILSLKIKCNVELMHCILKCVKHDTDMKLDVHGPLRRDMVETWILYVKQFGIWLAWLHTHHITWTDYESSCEFWVEVNKLGIELSNIIGSKLDADELQLQNNDLKSRNNDLEKLLQLANDKIRQKEVQIQTNQDNVNKFDSMTIDIAQLKATIRTNHKHIGCLETTQHTTDIVVNDLKSQIQDFTAHKSESESLKTIITRIDAEKDVMKNQITDLQREISTHNLNMSSVTSDLKNMTSDFNSKNDLCNKLYAAMQDIEDKNAKLNNEHTQLCRKLASSIALNTQQGRENSLQMQELKQLKVQADTCQTLEKENTKLLRDLANMKRSQSQSVAATSALDASSMLVTTNPFLLI